MRSLKELLAHFSKHAEHTHEAAVSAVYELGRNDARTEFQAGLGTPTPPATPSEGESSAKKETEQEHAQSPQVEAGQADGEPQG
jgi:hypothetical protein